MQIKASDFIATFLREQKTTHVFEVAGGMITHILDSLHQLGNTNIVSVHHEQAAAFAADGYGRCTGRPGIAMATSGPGATNLLTGIGSCYFDSSPALFITGQVNTYEQKRDKKIRQLGFQETDIVAMAQPITKKCFQIESAQQIESVMHEAYALAMNGRPGPVLIDIPMNLQRALIQVDDISFITRDKIPLSTEELLNACELILHSILNAKRPLILAGNGIECSRSTQLFRRFIEMINVPVITSLMALDSIPYTHPLRVGMIGSYGNRWANLAIGECDLMIVIGSRLDIRQTGADINGFRKAKNIIHIDCDEHEINNRVTGCTPVVCDIEDFLLTACAYFGNQTLPNQKNWLNEIHYLKTQWPDTEELKSCPGVNPNKLMHQIAKLSHKAAGYVVDVGNHQMWAAQSLELSENQLFLTSGGMGAMGFALPAAIGSSFSLNRAPMVVIARRWGFSAEYSRNANNRSQSITD